MYNLKEENNVRAKGFNFIAGIDEAGRGPLAGPVVAACVVCGPDFKIKNEKLKKIKDSKKLSAKVREELVNVIYDNFCEVGVGFCDNETIDRVNILQVPRVRISSLYCTSMSGMLFLPGRV